MKKIHYQIITFLTIGMLLSCSAKNTNETDNTMPSKITISKSVLADKIKGGWAGQTIGCTYGGPVEFIYNGTMIQDYIPIKWEKGAVKKYYDTFPGLYDDIYMDLTFVEVFDRLGINAPVDSIAQAFAKSEYPLWHANQQARYNILNGISPRESGNWLNNPHADDIDYQIEADFSGLMSPGMPNTASNYSDKIGHMICYGDGWYGGVYVGAMYSLAFVYNDIETIVTEALKTIPSESTYHQCISDVIKWHAQYPDDWKETWFECQKKWSEDYGCPDGVFSSLDIDAKINSAYVVIGLLYGQGDYTKTLDISTRCGQDADCNPATAAGILGTMLGYSNIPEYWKEKLYEVEDRDFAYTTISLKDVYELGVKQALSVIENNGGEIKDSVVSIIYQKPEPVALEQSFKNHVPIDRKPLNLLLNNDKTTVDFDGIGAVIRGYVLSPDEDYVAKVTVSVDGQEETIFLPTSSSTARKVDVFWKYQLPKGSHEITFKWLNPDKKASVTLSDMLIYSDQTID